MIRISRNLRASLALLAVAAAALAGCGGSPTRTSQASSSPGSVKACLQRAGYGVATVPAAEVASGGAENRGPGQTAELWVAQQDGPAPASADGAVAVIAFWDSPAHASGSPNARAPRLGSHADSRGSVTVQPTTRLALSAFNSARTAAARRANFDRDVERIEACIPRA